MELWRACGAGCLCRRDGGVVTARLQGVYYKECIIMKKLLRKLTALAIGVASLGAFTACGSTDGGSNSENKDGFDSSLPYFFMLLRI